MVVESTRLTARVWKALLEGMFAADKAEGLASAGIPTLLVWGEEDSVFPMVPAGADLDKMIRRPSPSPIVETAQD